MFQKDVAKRIGVDVTSVHNWETNATQPSVEYMPAIIEFLAYNPLPAAAGWGGRLVQARTALGLTQKQAAQRMGVDPGTLARWERGERKPVGAWAVRAGGLLAEMAASAVAQTV
jgi:transcriptional regulator with XRE-family HTH domain